MKSRTSHLVPRTSYFTIPVIVCICAIAALAYYYFFTPLAKGSETAYLYIDKNDNADSVFNKLTPLANSHAMSGFSTLMRHSHYPEHIRTGRYEIKPGMGSMAVFRMLKNGQQTPLRLTIPSVRTTERLAAELGKKLMIDSTEIINALCNPTVCEQYGYDTCTIPCMFIPNTYELYWNISLEAFLVKMKKESDNFWNEERLKKAEAAGMSPEQVITLASIVDEETAYNPEKPMIAGMYINRLRKDMPLQADPTVKFAQKQFGLKRIYNKHLSINSPYNTYRNKGLPPGPIRIPSVTGIDAVLNYSQSDYLYMCAKEDFSGSHNFAATYNEHLKNAAKYTKALNERGIK